MASLADMTKAPFKFRAQDGKEYAISPITPAILGEVERWIENLPFNQLQDRLERVGSFLDAEQRLQLYKEAEERSKKLKLKLLRSRQPGADDAVEADEDDEPNPLQTIQGVRKLFGLAVHAANPTISEEAAAELVTVDNLTEVQQLLDRAAGLDDVETPSGKAESHGTAQ